jgi:hypothetical protein
MIRWRQLYLRGFAAALGGVGLFFALFVMILMTPTCSAHALWILIIPGCMLIYGAVQMDKVDKFLTTTHEAWRR